METPNGGCPKCERALLSVTVFWDFENCTVPTDMKGFQVVSSLRSYVKTIGGILKNISAFGNLNLLKQDLRTELQQCGVLLHDVSSGKPSAADMALMVEFLKLACDCPPPHTVVLISGDRDFSNVLNVLVFRGYEVTLIHSSNASEVLKSAATVAMDWRGFLGKPVGVTKVSPRPSSTPPSPAKPAKAEVALPTVVTASSLTENEKKALRLLEAVIPWLKKEFFKPTETTIQNGCKREFKKKGETFTASMWNDVLSVIQKHPGFTILGQGPTRCIYFASDVFGGIDPSEDPKKGGFPANVWTELAEFLKEIHPASKLGRFGFAEFLREKGPNSIKVMPLAKIAQLVQVATNNKLLRFDKNVLHTVGPAEEKQTETTPAVAAESKEAEAIRCINEALIQSKRVPLSGLSVALEKRGLLAHTKQKGNLRNYLASLGIYELEQDESNNVWVASKDPLHLITNFVKERGGRVNIGTLSGYVQRIGKIKDGLKKFLVASDLYEFEKTKDGACWVILKSNYASRVEETAETETKTEAEEEEQASNGTSANEEKEEEFVEVEESVGGFVDSRHFAREEEVDVELMQALALSLSQL